MVHTPTRHESTLPDTSSGVGKPVVGIAVALSSVGPGSEESPARNGSEQAVLVSKTKNNKKYFMLFFILFIPFCIKHTQNHLGIQVFLEIIRKTPNKP
jgi:hypothetical protein